ncbi:MAG: AhpC/TSA family protein [Actinomycetota bacterium]|nr:AhpC/TSA family protein [Actinomycetota bacterium]
MSTTIIPTATSRPRPGQPAPDLTVALHGGGSYRLADARPDAFTMLVFFRGRHCPACHAQLRELGRRLSELTERGIELLAVSAETAGRTEQLVREWDLEHLRIGYGLAEDQMRAWGLFVSRGRGEDEPALFSEPAMFLIRSDVTVYYEAILSMPVGRPRLDDLLGGIDFWTANAYPARGEA